MCYFISLQLLFIHLFIFIVGNIYTHAHTTAQLMNAKKIVCYRLRQDEKREESKSRVAL